MMETTELLNQSSQLFDPVRQKWVAATPEEGIRQGILKKMVEELGYPLSSLAVERSLSQLPHLQRLPLNAIPKRRADIIVFAKHLHPDHALFPLVMVECKVSALTAAFAQQVIGYNAVVQASFLVLANREQILTGYFSEEAGCYRFTPGFPSYASLLASKQKI